MSRSERFGSRDWAWSVFHRSIPHPARMIDLDYIEFCPYCYETLILGEVAQDVGQVIKPTRILQGLCEKSKVKGIRIFYQHNAIAEAVRHVLNTDTSATMPALNPEQLDAVWNCLLENPKPILRFKYVYPSNQREWRITAAQFQSHILAVHQKHEHERHPELEKLAA